jgi:hypothetical protein
MPHIIGNALIRWISGFYSPLSVFRHHAMLRSLAKTGLNADKIEHSGFLRDFDEGVP